MYCRITYGKDCPIIGIKGIIERGPGLYYSFKDNIYILYVSQSASYKSLLLINNNSLEVLESPNDWDTTAFSEVPDNTKLEITV